MRQAPLAAFVIFVIAMFAVAEPLAAAAPHAESKKIRFAHKTFSNPHAIVIPDVAAANPYPSTIKVSGFKKGRIAVVNLRLRGLNHGNVGDIDVLLVAPDGRNALVMSDAAPGVQASNLTLTLDDGAYESLPLIVPWNDPLTSGRFKPTNYGSGDFFPGGPTPSGETALETFRGGDPNGAWRLYVVDHGFGNVGAFSGGWDLKIIAEVKKDKKDKKDRKHKGDEKAKAEKSGKKR